MNQTKAMLSFGPPNSSHKLYSSSKSGSYLYTVSTVVWATFWISLLEILAARAREATGMEVPTSSSPDLSSSSCYIVNSLLLTMFISLANPLP